MEGWTLNTLKEYLDALRESDLEANNNRFKAQEEAIRKAESNRDTAINKAETSIEKKSEAVYVKVTTLQSELGKVMLRPEIEGRFKEMAKEVKRLTDAATLSHGKGMGLNQGWVILISIVGLVSTLLAIGAAVAAILAFND